MCFACCNNSADIRTASRGLIKETRRQLICFVLNSHSLQHAVNTGMSTNCSKCRCNKKATYNFNPAPLPSSAVVVKLIRLVYLGLDTHTHPFNGPFSGTTQVSRYQKGKTNLDFTEARDSECQWHPLGQVCTSLQTDNHASIPPLPVFFTDRMPFLPPNQQRQSTEGNISDWTFSDKNNRLLI